MLRGFDGPLAFAVFLLACGPDDDVSSASTMVALIDHGRNMLIAGC